MKKESRQKETLGRILKYMKKYWLFLGLSIALAVIRVLLTFQIPIHSGDAIDYIVENGKVDFSKNGSYVYNGVRYNIINGWAYRA